MSAPRVEVDLDQVEHNARTLVERLAPVGIGVTGVTKATLGSPEVAERMVRAGVHGLGEARLENVERLRAADIGTPVLLVRSPMLSEVHQLVASVETSCNTELDVVRALSAAAVVQQRTHGVLLMVELGDLREGILPADVLDAARVVAALPGIELRGLGANLACQHGVVPDGENMGVLTSLVEQVEATFDRHLPLVSGGSSVTLEWALGTADVGRVDDLRLGESILLGREPAHRQPIDGLHTEAFSLVAEVIEAKVKPSSPWGDVAQAAFGPVGPTLDEGDRRRTIVAVGHQDTDPWGLEPPAGMRVLGASSDHLVVDAGDLQIDVGDEVRFGLGYGALVRAMTSSSTTTTFLP